MVRSSKGKSGPALFAVSAFIPVLLSGCEVYGTAVSQESISATLAQPTPTPPIRQTDTQGNFLPFQTTFPNRWNTNNDGTEYEPCTAVAETTVSSFGALPSTVRDVAVANFQTARGCRWYFGPSRTPSISQSVGNAPPITEYKERLATTFYWFPDQQFRGRTVAIGSLGPDVCTTFVRSGNANITSSYSDLNRPTPPLPTLCAKALEFTRATIDKMPP
ncbi:DUF3558 domain-containing protein [Gordonia desulfuricans]|uniref:DUF3558 domain-containing protein n=2 Tax=Gordonia desulfuricans TaxID=89051 RepID=A0A7K3LNC5_9ACTN|nr:DUF3558 domain-containing protein [Gordonia desulfuricans]